MPLINCEINLILTWSYRCFMIDNPIANQEPTFTITDTKLYVPAVTLSTQSNVKLLKQLKSGFKRIINWNKCEPKVIVQQQNQYLDFLSVQRINKLFVLPFEDADDKRSYEIHCLPLVEIKDYNFVIAGRNLFWSTNKK